jgi:hypothetical protein
MQHVETAPRSWLKRPSRTVLSLALVGLCAISVGTVVLHGSTTHRVYGAHTWIWVYRPVQSVPSPAGPHSGLLPSDAQHPTRSKRVEVQHRPLIGYGSSFHVVDAVQLLLIVGGVFFVGFALYRWATEIEKPSFTEREESKGRHDDLGNAKGLASPVGAGPVRSWPEERR